MQYDRFKTTKIKKQNKEKRKEKKKETFKKEGEKSKKRKLEILVSDNSFYSLCLILFNKWVLETQ